MPFPQHQHLPSVPKNQYKKKEDSGRRKEDGGKKKEDSGKSGISNETNNNKEPAGAWFYDVLKNAVAAYESGARSCPPKQNVANNKKSDNSGRYAQNKNQTLTASYPPMGHGQHHAKSKPIPVNRGNNNNNNNGGGNEQGRQHSKSFPGNGNNRQQQNYYRHNHRNQHGGKNFQPRGGNNGYAAGAGRPTSLTPPNGFAPAPVIPKPAPVRGTPNKEKPFYAGAKFETHPPCMSLPAPPPHWIMSLQK